MTEDYKPLVTNLEGYWETAFDDLPEELKPMVKGTFIPLSWDSLSAFQRLGQAVKYDKDNPESESELYWELYQNLYWELNAYYIDAKKSATKAQHKNNDAFAVWADVEKRLSEVIKNDRERVGTGIQELRKKALDAERLEALEKENQRLRAENVKLAEEPSEVSRRAYMKAIKSLTEALVADE